MSVPNQKGRLVRSSVLDDDDTIPASFTKGKLSHSNGVADVTPS